MKGISMVKWNSCAKKNRLFFISAIIFQVKYVVTYNFKTNFIIFSWNYLKITCIFPTSSSFSFLERFVEPMSPGFNLLQEKHQVECIWVEFSVNTDVTIWLREFNPQYGFKWQWDPLVMGMLSKEPFFLHNCLLQRLASFNCLLTPQFDQSETFPNLSDVNFRQFIRVTFNKSDSLKNSK